MSKIIICLAFFLNYFFLILGDCPNPYSHCNLGIDGFTNVHIIAHTHDDVGWKSTVDEFLYGNHASGVQYIIGIQ